jgi:hypothetical protein
MGCSTRIPEVRLVSRPDSSSSSWWGLISLLQSHPDFIAIEHSGAYTHCLVITP